MGTQVLRGQPQHGNPARRGDSRGSASVGLERQVHRDQAAGTRSRGAGVGRWVLHWMVCPRPVNCHQHMAATLRQHSSQPASNLLQCHCSKYCCACAQRDRVCSTPLHAISDLFVPACASVHGSQVLCAARALCRGSSAARHLSARQAAAARRAAGTHPAAPTARARARAPARARALAKARPER